MRLLAFCLSFLYCFHTAHSAGLQATVIVQSATSTGGFACLSGAACGNLCNFPACQQSLATTVVVLRPASEAAAIRHTAHSAGLHAPSLSIGHASRRLVGFSCPSASSAAPSGCCNLWNFLCWSGQLLLLRAKSRPSHRRMLTAVSLAAVINGLCSFCRGSLPASDSDHHRSVLPASGLVISEPMLPGHHSRRAPRSLCLTLFTE